MTVVTTPEDCRRAAADLGDVALVPTMGALHAGHLSLIKEAGRHAPRVAASLFVNPAQFNATDDLANYPRPLEDDLKQLESAGVDLVYAPADDVVYPPGQPRVLIDVPDLTDVLEGRHRPGHFRGVCLIVLKLLHLFRPAAACFGRKDFQQLRVIEAMVAGLDLPTQIVACPTVRDADGLALSSRNARLSEGERFRARAIPRSLDAAAAQVRDGVLQTNRLIATVRNVLMNVGEVGRGGRHGPIGHVPMNIDYVSAVDPTTLKPVESIDRPTLLAVASRVGRVRLIDNALLSPDGTRA